MLRLLRRQLLHSMLKSQVHLLESQLLCSLSAHDWIVQKCNDLCFQSVTNLWDCEYLTLYFAFLITLSIQVNKELNTRSHRSRIAITWANVTCQQVTGPPYTINRFLRQLHNCQDGHAKVTETRNKHSIRLSSRCRSGDSQICEDTLSHLVCNHIWIRTSMHIDICLTSNAFSNLGPCFSSQSWAAFNYDRYIFASEKPWLQHSHVLKIVQRKNKIASEKIHKFEDRKEARFYVFC